MVSLQYHIAANLSHDGISTPVAQISRRKYHWSVSFTLPGNLTRRHLGRSKFVESFPVVLDAYICVYLCLWENMTTTNMILKSELDMQVEKKGITVKCVCTRS